MFYSIWFFPILCPHTLVLNLSFPLLGIFTFMNSWLKQTNNNNKHNNNKTSNLSPSYQADSSVSYEPFSILTLRL